VLKGKESTFEAHHDAEAMSLLASRRLELR